MIRTLLALVVGYLVTVVCGMAITWPFDWAVNVGFAPVREELRLPADGKRRVVVLQHGIMRSAFALGRLARTLRAHGYEVENLDYPSTRGTIEQHAALLARRVAAVAGERQVDEWMFVGRSMGGLVIQEYLRRPDAVEPAACVYVATPQRGAVLADLRKRWFIFRWLMGTEAALQLSPGHPFHEQPVPFLDRSAVIRGDVGRGNPGVPGDDDGTISLAEAALPGCPCLTLPLGHTWIGSAPQTAEQVLAFLRRGRFEDSHAGR